jgi:IS5 family transposase
LKQNTQQYLQQGAPAKTFRMALGALIIKEKLGTSDRETVEQIRENSYLQYFIGMSSYSNQAPFDPSMLVHFRERIDMNLVNKLNQKIVKNVLENQEEKEVKAKKSEVEDSKSQVTNRGKLILDASCAPADISYPTDLELLNQSRQHTETIIDILYNSVKVKNSNKPRTYRKIARKDYLVVARKKNDRDINAAINLTRRGTTNTLAAPCTERSRSISTSF